MEPISFLSEHISGKVLDYAVEAFRENVIERWSRWRAEKFFGEFCRRLDADLASRDPEAFRNLLSELMKSESNSEVMFDAYRRVCLSRTRDIGPRIIAILTARMVAENRKPTNDEHIMLSAAETLSDDGFSGFVQLVRESQQNIKDGGNKGTRYDLEGNLIISVGSDGFDLNCRRAELYISPINLSTEYGEWAESLSRLGVVINETVQRYTQYSEDTERHIDEDGSVFEVKWLLSIPKPYLRFVDLIESATP